MSFAAVLVAAGSGQRLGAEVPKALVVVAGRPLVAHATTRLIEAGACRVVVVGPPDHLADVRACLPDADVPVDVVAGGATRAASVRAGLVEVGDEPVVAVHDAARAFAPPELVRRAVDAIRGDVVASAPALPVTDTLKRVAGDRVVETIDRHDLVAVQTPQAFRVEVLRAAHADGEDATDDLALVERLLATGTMTGHVVVVPGEAAATKITWPADIALVAALGGVPA